MPGSVDVKAPPARGFSVGGGSANRLIGKFLIREINETLILDVLRLRGMVARSELAHLTGLGPATITGVTAKLIDSGLVREVSRGPSTGGRPPRMLALNPAGGHDRCPADRPTHRRGRHQPVRGDRRRTDGRTAHGVADPTIDTLARVAATLRGRAPAPVIGMGVAVSGIVDPDTGVVRHGGQLGWEDVRLGPELADRLGIRSPWTGWSTGWPRRCCCSAPAVGRALPGAVANVAKIIGSQRVVLGGEGTRLGSALLEPFRKELHRAPASSGGVDVELDVIAPDGRTWAHGAACRATTELFRVSASKPAG